MDGTNFIFCIENAIANINNIHELHDNLCAYLRELDSLQTNPIHKYFSIMLHEKKENVKIKLISFQSHFSFSNMERKRKGFGK